MTIEADAYVVRYSPFQGDTYSVHRAIADETGGPERGESYPMDIDRLALLARVSPQSAVKAVEELEKAGFLERDPHDEQTYYFLMPRVPAVYGA